MDNVIGNIECSDLELGDELNVMLAEMSEARISVVNSAENTNSFNKLLSDAQCDLFPGSKMYLLSAIVKLLHLKVLNKWSNQSFNMLLDLIKEVLPEGDTLPSTLYGARKMLVDIGLGYEEIDVCKNDCSLFWRENEKEEACPICKVSRWKDIVGKKVPHKKLRYFPLKPRLQRLFMFSKTSRKMPRRSGMPAWRTPCVELPPPPRKPSLTWACPLRCPEGVI